MSYVSNYFALLFSFVLIVGKYLAHALTYSSSCVMVIAAHSL